MPSGWIRETSPFHEGEQQIQERLSVRRRLEEAGRVRIHEVISADHALFFRHLPFFVLGAPDEAGKLWVSIVAGPPGFVTATNEKTLSVGALPVNGDPLAETLKAGTPIGGLGIDLSSRSRARLNGVIGGTGPKAIDINVVQSFNNCPQYIQARPAQFAHERLEDDDDAPSGAAWTGTAIDEDAKRLIERADTFFITSAYAGNADDGTSGVDVSHRGGKPGFVKINDANTLTFPDYSGNFHFNTLGNILVDKRIGLVFADFETGDMLHLTGTAEIIWEGDEVTTFTGAERLVRCTITEVRRPAAKLPVRFHFNGYSPVLMQTGTWSEADKALAALRAKDGFQPLEVFRVEDESEIIRSFYLKRADGQPLAPYRPGQHLPIRLNVPGHTAPVLRTYTLSEAPARDGAQNHYRLSIKREGSDAIASPFMHENAVTGATIEARDPQGKFILDETSARPVVLLSGGVGITPMIAMLGALAGAERDVYFIHGALNGKVHAFGAHVRDLAAKNPNIRCHFRYSDPGTNDRAGEDFDSTGFIDMDLLKSLLPLDDYEFYLCGPGPFMQALYDGLTGLGVRDERIAYESFGPATVLKHDAAPKGPPPSGKTVDGPVKVRFEDAEMEVDWTPDKGTLLELAESIGLTPAFACRSGICGTCATKIACGAVDYTEEPMAMCEEGEVLICCATPRSASGDDSCGKDLGVILDL